MERFIADPNLPEGRATLTAVSEGAPGVIAALESRGIRCIKVPACPALPVPVSAHPDMVIHHMGGRDILLYDYSEALNHSLQKEGFHLTFAQKPPQPRYPHDVRLNVLRLGNYLVGRLPYIEQALLEITGIIPVDVRQGYAKCSVCAADINSVITADAGIAGRLSGHGIEVRTVPPGGISLPGYEEGLIGGCAGKLSRDVLAFTGSLERYDKTGVVRSFLAARHITGLSLTGHRMHDIGSILPLKEDISP